MQLFSESHLFKFHSWSKETVALPLPTTSKTQLLHEQSQVTHSQTLPLPDSHVHSEKQMQRGAEQTSATAVSIIWMNIADIILLCLDVEVGHKMEKMWTDVNERSTLPQKLISCISRLKWLSWCLMSCTEPHCATVRSGRGCGSARQHFCL